MCDLTRALQSSQIVKKKSGKGTGRDKEGTGRDKKVTGRDKEGTGRDKEGTGRDKEGTAGTEQLKLYPQVIS